MLIICGPHRHQGPEDIREGTGIMKGTEKGDVLLEASSLGLRGLGSQDRRKLSPVGTPGLVRHISSLLAPQGRAGPR